MGLIDEQIGNMRTELAKYKRKIDIVHFDDWVEIYKDEQSVYGNHSIRPEELLDILDVDYSSRYIDEWDYCKEIPKNLEDYDA